MSRVVNWALGGVAVAIFFAAHAFVELNEAQDVADATTEAITMADLEARRDALALQICQAELGPGTQAIWTVDGDLVCRPAVLTAQGGAR